MTTQQRPSPQPGTPTAATLEQRYEYPETRALVALVSAAADLVRTAGEAAFDELEVDGGRWRQGERYVFVLDTQGNMLVHPDAALKGWNQLELKDIIGRPIVRGLLEAATTVPDKPEGWYHYQWFVPGEMLPRWKSSYVRLVQAPSGTRYVVGSGMYDDRMERAFVVDMVTNAVALVEQRGEAAFPLLRDPTGPFLAKDAYVFVTGMDGVELVNAAFPTLEGRDMLDQQDTHGRYPNREMLAMVRTYGAGWVDYMWPRPGESVSTRKSTYVRAAQAGEQALMVGCGVYLADAPHDGRPATTTTAPALMTLVREAAAILAERGEQAYPDFRQPGSRWFRDDVYLFVFTMDGTRALHAAEPDSEGRDDRELRDAIGRPIVRMILDAAAGASGEGWVHYMYPEPGGVFPVWKSSFVKRVTFPSGTPHVVGCGIYRMQMDRAFIEDVVDRAAALIAASGRAGFGQLRDRTGPFVFMDTYVFVHDLEGTELVNPAQPTLEGRNLLELHDLRGTAVVREQVAAVAAADHAWLECYWYRPGSNRPARKQTYVRKVRAQGETFVVGSGIYLE